MQYNLEHIECELKKRLPYENKWFQKQNNEWDNATKFIYKVDTWEKLLEKVRGTQEDHTFEKEPYFYYAINRWYNFWSAMATEQIFTDMPGFAVNPKPLEDHYDFRWLGEKFDLKTSVFPKRYLEGSEDRYAFAKAHKRHLINWFYQHQSSGQRHHLNNRLFLVCHSEDGSHYKLKSEIEKMRPIIEQYCATKTPANTIKLELETGKETLADIIWIEE